MKQGTGKNVTTGGKVEPKPHGVGEGAVSRIGNHYVYTRPPTPMEAGRGFKAPMAAASNHKSGSQGKH